MMWRVGLCVSMANKIDPLLTGKLTRLHQMFIDGGLGAFTEQSFECLQSQVAVPSAHGNRNGRCRFCCAIAYCLLRFARNHALFIGFHNNDIDA